MTAPLLWIPPSVLCGSQLAADLGQLRVAEPCELDIVGNLVRGGDDHWLLLEWGHARACQPGPDPAGCMRLGLGLEAQGGAGSSSSDEAAAAAASEDGHGEGHGGRWMMLCYAMLSCEGVLYC